MISSCLRKNCTDSWLYVVVHSLKRNIFNSSWVVEDRAAGAVLTLVERIQQESMYNTLHAVHFWSLTMPLETM